jgi:PIF1-like helicase
MTVAVIYDECLMTHQHCFEALDQTFQDLHNSLILFGDDFQQILPVVLQGLFADIVDACLCMSYLWNDIIILKLCTNM